MNTKRLARLLRLIQLLESGTEHEVDVLAAAIDTDRRTFFREMNLLEDAGYHYRYDRAKKRYCRSHTMMLPPVNLTPAETFSLLLMISHGLETSLLPNNHHAVSAAQKLESVLPHSIKDECVDMTRFVGAKAPPRSDPETVADTFPVLQQAFTQQTKLLVRYQSFTEGKVREGLLLPYRIVHLQRGWYVIGLLEPADRPATFKLERFERMQLTEEAYSIDPSFTLDGYFRNAWFMIPDGDVDHPIKIRFSLTVAGNVEAVHWHKTQVTYRDADGSLIFEATVTGFSEIIWWILGYGHHAEVLEPAALRERIVAQLQSMMDTYARETQDGEPS